MAVMNLCNICNKPMTPTFDDSGNVILTGENNAWPIIATGVCCDRCEKNFVLPARLKDASRRASK